MSKTLNVLIVEQPPRRRSLLAQMLQNGGITVINNSDALSSLDELLGYVHFDAVFIEVLGADDPVIEVLKNARLDRENRLRTPVIVISDDRQRSTIERIRDAGADGFLARPFSQTALQVQLTRIVNDRRAFIVSESYAGPDRRRWADPYYGGRERRVCLSAPATSETFID